MDTVYIDVTPIPMWLALPVLLLILFGVWKLGKLVLLALRG